VFRIRDIFVRIRNADPDLTSDTYAQCRENRLFGLAASGEKGLSLSEGLGKEYMTWRETSVGKTGTQAEGRLVVIRASQGYC
jgi:hypothetical protein